MGFDFFNGFTKSDLKNKKPFKGQKDTSDGFKKVLVSSLSTVAYYHYLREYRSDLWRGKTDQKNLEWEWAGYVTLWEVIKYSNGYDLSFDDKYTYSGLLVEAAVNKLGCLTLTSEQEKVWDMMVKWVGGYTDFDRIFTLKNWVHSLSEREKQAA